MQPFYCAYVRHYPVVFSLFTLNPLFLFTGDGAGCSVRGSLTGSALRILPGACINYNTHLNLFITGLAVVLITVRFFPGYQADAERKSFSSSASAMS